MTDNFNLKKNKRYNNSKIINSEETEDNNKNKNKSCSSKDANNYCDYIIIDGINIGWIWNRIGDISTSLLNFVGNKDNKDKKSKTPKKHTNKDQEEDINKLLSTYNKIQSSIKGFIIIIIVFTLIYELNKANGDPGNDDYFSIVNICYFFKELIEHPKDYNLKFIIFFGIIQFITSGIPGLIGFLSLLAIGWIFLGNFLFKKDNVNILICIIVGIILIECIYKSVSYYNKRLDDDDPRKSIKKKNALILLSTLTTIISIITGVIILYLLTKMYSVNRISNITDGKSEHLSDYFEKNLFKDITNDQKEIITKIKNLIHNFNQIKESKQEGYKLFYKYYIETLLDQLLVKDKYIKNIVHSYNTNTYKSPNVGNIVSNLNSEQLVKILNKVGCKKYIDRFNNANFGKYISQFPKQNVNELWTISHFIKEYGKSILFRCLECIYLSLGQVVFGIINFIKLLNHFVFNNPNQLINSIHDLNLSSFKKFRLISSSNLLLAHKRLASMFNLYIVTK